MKAGDVVKIGEEEYTIEAVNEFIVETHYGIDEKAKKIIVVKKVTLEKKEEKEVKQK